MSPGEMIEPELLGLVEHRNGTLYAVVAVRGRKLQAGDPGLVALAKRLQVVWGHEKMG